jgi:two-component system chemotaxis sensor kinase CheA
MTTSLGRGTVFTLRLPVSISIVDSFAFLCGEAAFVVPISSVEEIVEVDISRLITPPGVRPGALPIQLLQRRGEAVPLVPLSGIFSGVAVPLAATSKALVVRRNGEPFAFAVDRMLGQQEIVVRPLEDPLVRVGGITGTTDLGDGKPTLVLDLLGLVSAAHREVSQA